MDGNLTYAACGLLIIAYAWARFNTPPSNRSSTRQTLYWSSAIGYMLSALVLFAALSSFSALAHGARRCSASLTTRRFRRL